MTDDKLSQRNKYNLGDIFKGYVGVDKATPAAGLTDKEISQAISTGKAIIFDEREKYKQDSKLKEILDKYLKNDQDMDQKPKPNIVFSAPSGTGKTAMFDAIHKQLLGQEELPPTAAQIAAEAAEAAARLREIAAEAAARQRQHGIDVATAFRRGTTSAVSTVQTASFRKPTGLG